MSQETFVEADIWTVAQTDQGNVVLVRPKGSDLAVPIFIGQLETQSILIGMGGVDVPRPLTHDLLISLARAFDASILRIEINDLREGTFFARVILFREGIELSLDARPSDAIGVAVRSGCPVFIAESVVDEAGISVNLVTEGGADSAGGASIAPAENRAGKDPGNASPDELSPANGELIHTGSVSLSDAGSEEARRLRRELEDAIANEDYERAAVLRDRLRDLG